MAIVDDLTTTINDIANGQWDTTNGQVVPESSNVGLGNKGVKLEATVLYSDLANSTALAMHSRAIAAEVYKAFLACCSKIIRHRDGHIRSFDGDRVMGIFIGGSKNTNAAKAALNINHMYRKLLVPRFKQQYEVFQDGTLTLAHCAGVDTGAVLAARGGIRNNNDLIWLGRAPNVAAKLSTRRNPPYYSYLTANVFNNMGDEAKYADGKPMWENRTWDELPVGQRSIYRSSWTWRL